MKYGIVQEVMKVEERKAIRREMSNQKAQLHQQSLKKQSDQLNQDLSNCSPDKGPQQESMMPSKMAASKESPA